MRSPIGKIKNEKARNQLKRKLRVRKLVNGTSEKPRLCVTKSNKNLFVQVIDDSAQKTLLSVQSFGKNKLTDGINTKNVAEFGQGLSTKLKDQNLTRLVFDRNGRTYAGLIKLLAESLRENGIQL